MSAEPPTTTWLLPVRNGLPYLPETLASIAAQTYSRWQVLAWDNGSDDGTLAVLHEWIPGRLPGVVVADRPLPLGASLAAMVEQCETEYCARIDADDVNVAERLALQVAYLEAHPDVALVGSACTAMDAAGVDGAVHTMPSDHRAIVHALLYRNPIAHPAAMFRRQAVLDAGSYEDREAAHVEDYDLWLRLAVRHRLANLPQPLLRYRVHSSSSTAVSKERHTLQSAMDNRFCDRAAALFGLTPHGARALVERRAPNFLNTMVAIARYLHRTQGGTTASHLFSRSFILAASVLVAPNDPQSRILLRICRLLARVPAPV